MQTEPLFTSVPSVPQDIVSTYQAVRQITEEICAPLAIEDYGLQGMDDASPAKWHLGHVTWFFETFLLKSMLDGYKLFNPVYEYLLNSYYDGVGPQWTRAYRAHLSRPTVAEVYDFCTKVDRGMLYLVEATGPEGCAPSERL